jgi:hypothetical protein
MHNPHPFLSFQHDGLQQIVGGSQWRWGGPKFPVS